MAAVAELKTRRAAAARDRQAIQPLIDEAYDYAVPYRRSTRDRGAGEKRVDKVFDHTTFVSAFRFSGKLQQDLWPPGQQNFLLEPGPIAKASNDNATLDQLAAELAKVSTVAGAAFLDGEWDQAFSEMALDLLVGTGAMLILKGDDDKIARFVTVPLDEVLIEGGPYGDIVGIFWTRKWSLRSILQQWPKADLIPDLRKLAAEKPETEIDLHQDTVWDPAKKRWAFRVWSPQNCDKSSDRTIDESESRTCPWLTPRYFKLAGEVYGRGLTMLAMPTIKTLNTASRISLQAAAIAMLGIYTAVDDGVFNPDNARVEPGAFWKVARNGGTLGPSIQRFPDPRIDLNNIILNDLRMGVQSAMMDQSLPPDGAAVRSATEIIERIKRLASDHQGAFGRLVAEIVVPAVKRVIEICWDRGLLAFAPPIDQLLVKLQVTSPLAIARMMESVQRIGEAIQFAMAIMPDQPDAIVKRADAGAEVVAKMGVEPRFIVTADERKAAAERQQALTAGVQAVQAASAGAAAGAADPLGQAPAEPTPEMTR